jgi:hypothetical protein
MTFTFKLERLDGTPADPPSMQSTVTNWRAACKQLKEGGESPRCRSQMTYVKRMIANTTLWALCTAIPIQALR